MKKTLMHFALFASMLSPALVLAQASTTPKSNGTSAKAAAKDQSAQQQDPGQRKFNANCGRCHSFPETLSPSITGTVVRHMRVRANLSAQDEKDILRFLAP